jgi:hypothetical protein
MGCPGSIVNVQYFFVFSIYYELVFCGVTFFLPEYASS